MNYLLELNVSQKEFNMNIYFVILGGDKISAPFIWKPKTIKNTEFLKKVLIKMSIKINALQKICIIKKKKNRKKSMFFKKKIKILTFGVNLTPPTVDPIHYLQVGHT